MTVSPIKTDDDLRAALARIDEIFDAEPGTPESDELDVLAVLVERYEDDHYPIGPPHPVEAIKFRLAQLGKTQQDFAKLFGRGSRSRASEILNRKRPLTLKHIRTISRELRIPPAVLIEEYALAE